ncbi:hypothetical protein GOP80_04820 [Planococcaceae bacterium Storch 2/2-2]|nr:hypothetical protein [Planococcaceae bacterium Storch 2/2-2]
MDIAMLQATQSLPKHGHVQKGSDVTQSLKGRESKPFAEVIATVQSTERTIDEKGNVQFSSSEQSLEEQKQMLRDLLAGDLFNMDEKLPEEVERLLAHILEEMEQPSFSFENLKELATYLLDDSLVQEMSEKVEGIPFLSSLDEVMEEMKQLPLFDTLKQLLREEDVEDVWALIESFGEGDWSEAIERLPLAAQVQLSVVMQYVDQAASRSDLHAGQEVRLQQFQQMLGQIVEEQATMFAQRVTEVDRTQPSNPLPLTITNMTFVHTLTAETEQVSRSEELMKQLQAILKRANFGQTGGMNRLSVRLYPEHLGTLRIELQEVNGVLSARILASTAQAREMLDRQLHQLRAALMNQNLQVEKIELSQMLQQTERSEREGLLHDERKEQRARHDREKREESEENEKTFEEFLIELEEM